MTVIEKIRAGNYSTNKRIPRRGEFPEEELFLSATRSYQQEYKDTTEQFKADLEAEFKVCMHSKKDRLFELAREYGHSNGWHEIYHYYSELVDLIR